MKSFLQSFLIASLLYAVPAVAADLPTGEALFLKSIEKGGGAEALAKVKTTAMTGTMNMPAQGVSGTLKIVSEGEKSHTLVELPGIGKIEDGYDGNVAWEVSAIQGARLKEGDEKTALKNSSSIGMLRDWKTTFKSLKTLGVEDVEGKPAYKVEATPKEGKPMTMFFDQTSGLVVKVSMIAPSPMGEIPIDMLLTDYKSVNGVMTPFTSTQKVMTASMVMHFDKIEYNVELPKDSFAIPGQIQALLDKKK